MDAKEYWKKIRAIAAEFDPEAMQREARKSKLDPRDVAASAVPTPPAPSAAAESRRI